MPTLKTWNASNWMFRLLSRSKFIISFKFSARLMYFVMTVKLCRSRRSSPRSWGKKNRVNQSMHGQQEQASIWDVTERLQAPSETAVWWRSFQNGEAFRTPWTPGGRLKKHIKHRMSSLTIKDQNLHQKTLQEIGTRNLVSREKILKEDRGDWLVRNCEDNTQMKICLLCFIRSFLSSWSFTRCPHKW